MLSRRRLSPSSLRTYVIQQGAGCLGPWPLWRESIIQQYVEHREVREIKIRVNLYYTASLHDIRPDHLVSEWPGLTGRDWDRPRADLTDRWPCKMHRSLGLLPDPPCPNMDAVTVVSHNWKLRQFIYGDQIDDVIWSPHGNMFFLMFFSSNYSIVNIGEPVKQQ
jgi:hypothetical protein